MSFTTYTHLPPAGSYRGRTDRGLRDYVFVSRGTGDTMDYTYNGTDRREESGVVYMYWIVANPLERIAE